jgi:aspartyl protease family protein
VLKSILVTVGVVAGAAFVAPDLLSRLALPEAEAPRVAAAAPIERDVPGRVTLRADPDGHFRVDATIGGRRTPMLVDTGATVVALAYDEAERLGLVRAGDRFDVGVSTANGRVGAKSVMLNEVRIGGLSVSNVQALVLPRGAMAGNLLGMSFLGKLRRFEASRDQLVLER